MLCINYYRYQLFVLFNLCLGFVVVMIVIRLCIARIGLICRHLCSRLSECALIHTIQTSQGPTCGKHLPIGGDLSCRFGELGLRGCLEGLCSRVYLFWGLRSLWIRSFRCFGSS